MAIYLLPLPQIGSLAPPRNLGPKQQFRNLINLTILANMLVFSFINIVSARYRDLIGKIYRQVQLTRAIRVHPVDHPLNSKIKNVF